jgi:hypothetical protein
MTKCKVYTLTNYGQTCMARNVHHPVPKGCNTGGKKGCAIFVYFFTSAEISSHVMDYAA